MAYMADVSAILKGSKSDWQIMWELPLSDGFSYQAEHWLREGIELRRRTQRGKFRTANFFRA